MKTIEQIAAEILVECGYAGSYEIDKREHLQHHPPVILIPHNQDTSSFRTTCDPFSDTLEGRRQADAIEDWLYSNHYKLWGNTPSELDEKANGNHHQWRLDRIKWCLEQLRPERTAKTAP